GGDTRVVDRPEILPAAAVRRAVGAREDGFIAEIDALEIGFSAVSLGAGRSSMDDELDHAVGIEILAPVGSEVEKGEPIAAVHASDEGSADSVSGRIAAAFGYSSVRPERGSRVLEDVGTPAAGDAFSRSRVDDHRDA
ncbi:MAG: hypothetical protein GF400_03380, partial [Candidatus Eisenbacteria bacterium]|nr:hypothetical protein [Candidatus Eisenbacteria bacterium]